MGAWLRRMDGAELWGVALLSSFLLLSSAAPLVTSFAVSPEQIERNEVQLSPPCPTRARTGRGCPACGLTRGFTAMSRLRLDDARAYNAAAPWLYLGCWAITLGSGIALGRVGLEAARRPRRADRSGRGHALRSA